MRRVVILSMLVLMVSPVAAQAPVPVTFANETIESLMERSPSFREEVGPILHLVTFNTAEHLPGNALAIFQPEGGVGTLFFDIEKVRTLTPAELEIAIIHELYGHVVPELRGDTCRDPVRGQSYRTSCVFKREAKILREIGLKPRVRYVLR